MDAALGLLEQLGFGEYEAKAYAALLQRSPQNGYELAKASHVPRPNIYSVLERLEQRGAVLRVDTPSGTRYSPVSPGELTQRLSNRFSATLDAAQQTLSGIVAPAAHDYVWNTSGYEQLLGQAGALIDGARERLLIALWPEEARALSKHLASALQRGVSLTTLCLTACVVPCGHCRGEVHRARVAPEPQQRWLVLIPDDEELLASQTGPGDDSVTVRTRQRLLVDVATWYVRHTIALAAIMSDLGRQPSLSLSPETRSLLQSIAFGGPGGGWLENMRQLLSLATGENAYPNPDQSASGQTR
jgi:sugar-specific transcriptional regulator TrmB